MSRFFKKYCCYLLGLMLLATPYWAWAQEDSGKKQEDSDTQSEDSGKQSVELITGGDGVETEKSEECVILLHDIKSTPASMQVIADYLTAQGYQVNNVGYRTDGRGIKELSAVVEDSIVLCQLQHTYVTHLIGHSLGAILIRYYLANFTNSGIGRVILIAPPNRGMEIAYYGEKLLGTSRMKDKYGGASLELSHKRTSLVNTIPLLESEDIGIIAGTGHRTLRDFFFAIFIKGLDDGLVSLYSTRMRGIDNYFVTSFSHEELIYSKNVRTQIGYFLLYGSFSPIIK